MKIYRKIKKYRKIIPQKSLSPNQLGCATFHFLWHYLNCGTDMRNICIDWVYNFTSWHINQRRKKTFLNSASESLILESLRLRGDREAHTCVHTHAQRRSWSFLDSLSFLDYLTYCKTTLELRHQNEILTSFLCLASALLTVWHHPISTLWSVVAHSLWNNAHLCVHTAFMWGKS